MSQRRCLMTTRRSWKLWDNDAAFLECCILEVGEGDVFEARAGHGTALKVRDEEEAPLSALPAKTAAAVQELRLELERLPKPVAPLQRARLRRRLRDERVVLVAGGIAPRRRTAGRR